MNMKTLVSECFQELKGGIFILLPVINLVDKNVCLGDEY